MKRSDAINELAAALSKAQAEFAPIRKQAENPYFKSKYADLDAYRSATVPALSKHGLAVTQLAGFTNGMVEVETVLMHSSGQWISGNMAMRPLKEDCQAAGSVLSYIRRYSYSAILSCAGEDDDGNQATHQAAPAPAPAPKVAPVADNLYHATPDDKRWLADQCKAGGVTDKEHWTILNGLLEGKEKSELAGLIIKARKELESM